MTELHSDERNRMRSHHKASDRIRAALIALAAALVLPSAAAAGNAIATRPASVHAAPNANSKVIALIGREQVLSARNCRKGWCAAQGGYVQSSYLRFTRAAADPGYDYNVPLALPPYGYTPGFWGFGGRRHYDQFGNYTKFGQRGYADTDTRGEGPVEKWPRGLLGPR
jgi:hypothetical protein